MPAWEQRELQLKPSTSHSFNSPRATRATNYLSVEVCTAQHQGDRLKSLPGGDVTRAAGVRGHPEQPHVLPYSPKSKSHPGPAWLFQQ